MEDWIVFVQCACVQVRFPAHAGGWWGAAFACAGAWTPKVRLQPQGGAPGGSPGKTQSNLYKHRRTQTHLNNSRLSSALALWQTDVPLEDGRAKAAFSLPEFVGEVRVTAVVCSSRAAGAKSVQRKVTPRLVIQPDAPRFVAPGDEFEVALPVSIVTVF